MPNLDPSFELILVDDASTEDVLSTLPSLPPNIQVTTLSNPAPLGYAPSVNRAMLLASGEYIIHLNTDLILRPDTIRNLLSTLSSNPRVGLVGAKLVYPQTGLTQHIGMAFSDCNKFHIFHQLPHDHTLASRSREVQATTGAILGFSKALYQTLGPMDSSLYNCNEDVDYCLRAKKAGYSNFVNAKAWAYHWESQSGYARFVRAIENEALFWGKWLTTINPDITGYMRESLELMLRTSSIDLARFQILNLSKGANDRYLISTLLEAAGHSLRLPVLNFLQVNNPSSCYWLPMILPFSLILSPSPFVYIVDSYHDLTENYYWFKSRLSLVGEEIIADHTGCFLLTSELLASPPHS
jgi:GT2 family glycosyltransferase